MGRSQLTSKRADGYSGRGRRNRQTNGRILQASSTGGSRRTPLTASTPISVIDAPLRPDIDMTWYIDDYFLTITNALSPRIFLLYFFHGPFTIPRLAVGR